MTTELKGGCLCGSVQYQATGELKRVSACYCSQCRKQNGGGPFYAAEFKGELRIEDEAALAWFGSSEKAERGFCQRCGSSLFWRSNEDPAYFDVSIGTLADVSGLTLDAHIFVDSCPAYITISDDARRMTEADVHANPL